MPTDLLRQQYDELAADNARLQTEVRRLEGHLQIARAALEELAKIEDSQGWTQNMAARVALHRLDGRL